MNRFWILVVVVLDLLCAVSSHDLTHDELINRRGCASYEKTQELMNRNKEYKKKHDLEHKRANQYVAKMKKRKKLNDRPFAKKFDKKGGSGRGLLADYDDPDIKDRYFSSSSSDTASPVIRIPIIYHVLYSKDSENLSDEQLDSQISVLNKDFGAKNDEIESGEVAEIWKDRVGDSKFEFYKNATYRVSISSSEAVCMNESIMKNTSNGGSSGINPKYNLNVWVCDISSAGLLGYVLICCSTWHF